MLPHLAHLTCVTQNCTSFLNPPITNIAPQLLITFEYDQNVMADPPFAISHEEINQHYQNSYSLTRLASADVPGGLKGKCSAIENVWLLKND